MPERRAMTNDSSAGIERVGIAGWGRMGEGIGRHLIAGGVEVMAYDPAEATRPSMLEVGAKVASSVAELAASNDLVLVIVVDDAQVRKVLEGRDGVIAHSRSGTVLAVCASVRPDTCQDLAQQAEPDGVHVIDMALTGGERGAQQASLRLMCGGPEAVIDRCRPTLAFIASDVCHVGSVGAGQVAKTANNILLWACIRADYEVLSLAKRFGIAPGKLRTFMAVGSGANRPLAEWGQHRLRWPQKDLETAVAMAKEVGVDMPLTESLIPLMGELTADQLRALR